MPIFLFNVNITNIQSLNFEKSCKKKTVSYQNKK